MTVEQGLFKRHFVGRDNFIWWLGQIVDETTWSGNIPGYRTPTTSDHKGFEYRYKVRIMGYHTGVPSELSDEDLPWASVMYPTTAGAGTGGCSQTPNLKQGMFVYGFFLDGEDAQQPIIMGVLGYNDYTQVLNNIPDAGFIPFEGYKYSDEPVAKPSLRTIRENPLGKQSASSPSQAGVNNTKVQGVTGYNALLDAASKQQHDKGQKEHSIPKTSVCEKQPLGQIQLEILNLVKDIEKARKSITDWETKVSTNIDNAQRWIEERVKFAADKVAQGIQWVITEIEKYTIKLVNDKLKDTYFLLFPNQRPNLKTAVETANDLLACLFKKIIGNLYKLVSNLLLSVFDKLINIPICFIEQFGAVILGSVFNEILSGIASVFDTISGIVGTAFDVVGDILGFIADIFSFLTCDTAPECPEIDTWSPWDGPSKTASFDIQGLFNQVKNFANQLGSADDIVEGVIGSISGSIASAADGFNSSPLGGSCNVGPFRCGPPTVEFFGGEGSGATGNVIIGFTGEILGVDIITEGGRYAEPPFVKFKDSCGKGSGAVGRAILEFDPDVKEPIQSRTGNRNGSAQGCIPLSGLKNGRVVAVVIEEPGKNYLYSYDGSEGGGGRTFANYCETMVRRSSGCYDLPYVSGQTIQLNPGDWVKYPNSSRAIRVTQSQTVTAPVCGDYDSSNPPPGPPPISRQPDPFNPSKPVDDENYPIDLELNDVEILEPGYDYQPGDPIVFVPTPSADPNDEVIPPRIIEAPGGVSTPEGISSSGTSVPGGGTSGIPGQVTPGQVTPGQVTPGQVTPGQVTPGQVTPENQGRVPDAFVDKVDSQGGIISIRVSNPKTFVSYPHIFVISTNGFNAKLAPRFTINRLTQQQIEEKITTGQPILSVIDCVGKIPPKQQFDIVP